jgi:hypothetical protein
MPRQKPLGWPRYMVPRPLKSGAIGFYWVLPSWAKKNGCTLKGEALGDPIETAGRGGRPRARAREKTHKAG